MPRSAFEGYEKFVADHMSPASTATQRDLMLTAALGLAGEAGEVVDIIKKICYHGMPMDKITIEKLIKESGDIGFYWFLLNSMVLGATAEEILAENVAKLEARYPSGTFTSEEFMKKERAS